SRIFTMNRRPPPKPITPPARQTSSFSTGDDDWFIAASSMPAGPETEFPSPEKICARRSTPCSPGKPLQNFKHPASAATSNGRRATSRIIFEGRRQKSLIRKGLLLINLVAADVSPRTLSPKKVSADSRRRLRKRGAVAARFALKTVGKICR